MPVKMIQMVHQCGACAKMLSLAGVTIRADGNPLTASGGYYTVTNTGATGACG